MTKRKADRAWWEQHRERFERTDRLLRARILHHRRKLVEENPDLPDPADDDGWAAHHDARIAALLADADRPR